MPIANMTEARDEINLHFTTIWNAQGTPPPLYYDDRAKDLPSSGSYARITISHTLAPARTVGGNKASGGAGQRFEQNGLVNVQVFTDSDDGLTTGDLLVNIAVNAFRGQGTSSGNIIFRNTRPNEIGQDGPWHQTNVITEFVYDSVI